MNKNYRINYRYLLPITIGNGQKLYIQGSVVRRTPLHVGDTIVLSDGTRAQVMQSIKTMADLTGE